MKLYTIYRRLQEDGFSRALQRLLLINVSTFLLFFNAYSKVINGVDSIALELKFFILALLEVRKIHSRSTLNSAYNESNIFFINHFLLYIKGKLPRPIHLVLHQLSSIPPAKLSIHFLCCYECILFRQI